MSRGEFPLVEELIPAPEVPTALRAFAGWRGVVLLESALHRDPVGRYSFLTADPFHSERIQDSGFGIQGTPESSIAVAFGDASASPP